MLWAVMHVTHERPLVRGCQHQISLIESFSCKVMQPTALGARLAQESSLRDGARSHPLTRTTDWNVSTSRKFRVVSLLLNAALRALLLRLLSPLRKSSM